MLLPPMNPQSASPHDELRSEFDPLTLHEEAHSVRIPLRECHSIPNSLPPTFPKIDVDETPSPEDASKASRRDSKSVRFSLDGGSVRYFNPTEKPSLVQKMDHS
ncbi:uncharacterized protein BJX67DRAFT_379738 [Aspergillus lucknowensis]|uniref:Uncharacterized protein n=1 Tax=Aspergillus lucknowensis TaxID=176173 RepID=A0ABR4LW71_9EURO